MDPTTVFVLTTLNSRRSGSAEDTGVTSRTCSSDGCGAQFSIFQWKYFCGNCSTFFCAAHLRKWTELEDDDDSRLGQLRQHRPTANEHGEGLCSPCQETCIDEYEKAKAVREAEMQRRKAEWEEQRRQREALEVKARDVTLYSANYRGRIPVTHSSPEVEISTNWMRDRSAAEFELQVEAVKNGCDIVFDVRFEKSMESEPSNSEQTNPDAENYVRGTHYYSVFRYAGIGSKQE